MHEKSAVGRPALAFVIRSVFVGLSAWVLFSVCCRSAFALPGPLPSPTGFDPSTERAALLSGVSQVTSGGGTPGTLGLFEPQAFPVLVSGDKVVVAASTLGTGRVVALPHISYLLNETLSNASNAQLMLNAVRWTTRHKPTPRVAVLGSAELVTFLNVPGHDINAEAVTSPISASTLTGHDLFVFSANALTSMDNTTDIEAFIDNGGGAIAAGIGWAWATYASGGRPLGEFAGNRALAKAGLAFIEPSAPSGDFDASAPAPLTLSAAYAYNALAELPVPASGLDATLVKREQTTVFDVMPLLPACLLRSALEELVADIGTVGPTEAQPFVRLEQPFRELGVHYLSLRTITPGQMTAVAVANDFPGAVAASAPHISKTLTVDTSVPGWHSTGMYAVPGSTILIGIPASATSTNLRVQIGSHTDELWSHPTWTRMPQIVRTFPLNSEVIAAANEFGGLIYVLVPDGSTAGPVEVTILGGVAAPRYVAGSTTLADWQNIRNEPGPWAELEGQKAVITVQSSLIRTLADPSLLTDYYDKLITVEDSLHRRLGDPVYKDRLVFDREISAGSAHSGYPVMALLGGEATAVDINRLLVPNGDTWGFYHEWGHNRQNDDWTPCGAEEVTNNIFSLYAVEQMTGHPKEDGISAISRASQNAALTFYFDARSPGSYENDWKKDPWLALTMYVQLIDAFGWDSFRTVFQTYRDNPLTKKKSFQNNVCVDDGVRDEWVTRYSTVVNRNLAPFFDAWHMPFSQAARDAASRLPSWDWSPPVGPAGWYAEYFPNTTLSGVQTLTRNDRAVNFSWGSGSPDPALPADNFSVRWTGRVIPDFTQTYTFETTTDDGVRLWVNGSLLIDHWFDWIATTNTASVALTKGQPVDVRLEYYEHTGSATATLKWSSASQAKVPIITTAAAGLLAEYFTYSGSPSLEIQKLTRVDPSIGFDWGMGSPSPNLPSDQFAVRWTGQVTPLYTDTYTFYTTTDDGVRLYVNDQLLIDNWVDQGATERSGSVTLTAGRPAAIRLEYYENGGAALAKLEWQSSHQTREIVPTHRLSPGGLVAQYFRDTALSQLRRTRIDRGIDFDWGWPAPDRSFQRDLDANPNQTGFSVRWSGKIIPRYTEGYTISTITDDGVRIWINGQLVRSDWTNHGPTMNSATVSAVAGVPLSIQIEYYNDASGGMAQLLWESARQPSEPIPAAWLYPAL